MLRVMSFGLVLVVLAGCACSRRTQRNCPPVSAPPPPSAIIVPGGGPLYAGQPQPGQPIPGQGFPGGPPPGAQFQPPPGAGGQVPMAPPGPNGQFPTAPSGPTSQFPTLPPNGPTNGATQGPPSGANLGAPPGTSSQSGRIEPNWQPAEGRVPSAAPGEGRVLLAPPEPEGANKEQKNYPPTIDASPKNPAPNGPAPTTKPAPTTLPVGIPQFTPIKQNIATGLRPSSEEGLEWLKKKGYVTIVQIRLPGENDDADRKVIENLGMKYQSFEMSPHLVTKDTVDEFFKLVRDPMQQPMFVYDRDGALAGGMWYLYFRLVEQDSDEIARIRARSAGFREDREGAHREMWQAVQRFLAEARPR